MPVGVSAYVALANITLSSSASSVTFSSIPSTYRDLVIISNLLNTVNTVDGFFAFNGDTNGSNYSRVYMYSDGISNISGSAGGQSIVPRTAPGVLQINIMDYSATDKQKTSLVHSHQAANITYTQASRWLNTAAITSIRISPADGSFASGATFALYGISS
jgi:hypothetical protein